jgi:hypothetical protein
MASYQKFNAFVEYLLIAKAIDFDADTFKVMLCNTAPVSTNSVKADLTEISAGNGYTAGGTATTITHSRSTGTSKIVGTDVVFTAAGGSIGPFRYAVLYDDTPAGTPTDPLVGFWDYGSSVTLADTETFTVDFDGTNGIFQLA